MTIFGNISQAIWVLLLSFVFQYNPSCAESLTAKCFFVSASSLTFLPSQKSARQLPVQETASVLAVLDEVWHFGSRLSRYLEVFDQEE